MPAPLYRHERNVADISRLRALCPQSVTEKLVGSGHYFSLEVPDQINAMIARFVQSNVVSPPR